ncbi:MAG: hypothetical protein HY962_14860 [Ignavibacteriae bacterium]|nr:hypothetical protein [Ignavibacteriota bacterium]
MKTTCLALIVLALTVVTAHAQNVNWKSIDAQRPNRLQLNLGYDYAATTSLAYSRSFTAVRPVVAGIHVALPMGERVFDDVAIRTGAQVSVFEWRGFTATAKIESNFRRFQNAMVRMVSFGADLTAMAGYYDPAWYAAAEFGFDKAVTTQLVHSAAMRRYGYAGIRDGWYVPTGGNYHYGVQAGLVVTHGADLSLRLGATNAQFDDTNAMLPYYLQFGCGVTF